MFKTVIKGKARGVLVHVDDKILCSSKDFEETLGLIAKYKQNTILNIIGSGSNHDYLPQLYQVMNYRHVVGVISNRYCGHTNDLIMSISNVYQRNIPFIIYSDLEHIRLYCCCIIDEEVTLI